MFDYNSNTIWIYDEITSDGYGGISAGDVVGALDSVGTNPVNVKINSPGGDVFQGLAIYEALKNHPAKVTTSNDALAASIASIIYLAGDEKLAAPNSFLMIHDPYSGAMGTADDLRKQAELLDMAAEQLTGIYVEETQFDAKSIKSLMSIETWFNFDESIENGLSDGSTRQAAVEAAPVAKQRFRNTPAALVRDLKAGSRTPHMTKLAELENKLKLLKSKIR